jgi:Cdc6-like AAA superfamily ATPase
MKVISTLFEERSNGKLVDFKFAMINAMSLRNPYEAYAVLWKSISGVEANPVNSGEMAVPLRDGCEVF